jgi:acetyltransferase-like isoleucine patch superfamily enzyme
MRLLQLLRNQIRKIRRYLVSEIRYAGLVCANPTCQINHGVVVDEKTRLSRFNVLFDGVVLIDTTVGDHTYFQKDSTAMSCDVGKYCSIAMHAFIGLPQHEIDTVSSHPVFYLRDTPLVRKYCKSNRTTPDRRTAVGHDVWIGHGALVMSGIKVGTGAIVGAGSVVTRDVPDYAIVGGAPAKFIRYRFDELLREQLLKSKWWEMSDEWLEAHVELFSRPAELLIALECAAENR